MTLTDCTSYWLREAWLECVYWGTPFPFEDPTVYQWTPTEFRVTLHTASPGEAGSATTSEATYTGYVAGGIAIPRGAAYWTKLGAGTANVRMVPTVLYSWPENTGADQNIAALAVSMVSSGVLYEIDYVVLGSPVTVATGTRPYIPALGMELRTR